MTPVFLDIATQWASFHPVSGKCISSTCTALVLPLLIVLRDLDRQISFHSGSQVQTIISSPFFRKLVISVDSVVTHKSWVYHRLNSFKPTGMIYYNSTSLMILLSLIQSTFIFIHFLTFSSLFTLQVYISHSQLHQNLTYFATNVG